MKHSRAFAACVAAALAFGTPSLIGRAQSGGAAPAGPFDGLHWRQIGPASMSGPHFRHRRLRRQHQYLVRRHRARRRVEDREQRDDVRAAVPGSGSHVDRRHRRVAEQSRPRLRRHRRVEQPPEHVVGRRHLQVDRRRQDLHQHRPEDSPSTSTASSSIRATTMSSGSRPPVRCSARRRARRLQDDRRRQDVEADA